MNFSSIAFLFFFLFITVIIYKCLPQGIRNLFLVAASLVFCLAASPESALIAAVSVIINFVLGFFIARSGKKAGRRLLALSVFLNLSALALFKYSGLIAKTAGFELPFEVMLPIGISYYTFSAISSAVDIYNREASGSFIGFAAYMLMFPKLLQGPIVKYKELAPMLESPEDSVVLTAEGIRRFICGLAKKVLIANQLANLHAGLLKNLTSNGSTAAWTAVAAYSLYIYFDFSAYTDMALGIGKMLGFNLPENFEYPYTAKSITDFWRRWHITLSRWFRDYLYIPLGGNRKGRTRTIFNLFAVWAATGLWHGASWNFLLWGIYYFLLLVAEKFIFKNKPAKIPVLNHLYTLFFVSMGWILFSCGELSLAGDFFRALFAGGNPMPHDTLYLILSYLPTVIIALIGSTPLPKRIYRRIFRGGGWVMGLDFILSAALLILCTAAIVSGSYTPFLYTAF